jgi:hypothetical protein
MVVNAMKASLETLYLLKKDRKFARDVLKKYLRIDDDAMIAIGIDYYLTKHGEGALTLPDRKGLEFVIADTAKTNPKAKGQTPSRCASSTAVCWMRSRKADLLIG